MQEAAHRSPIPYDAARMIDHRPPSPHTRSPSVFDEPARAEAQQALLPLRTRVDALSHRVHAGRPQDMQCRAGCASCCAVELTVCSVEAAALYQALLHLPTSHLRALADHAEQATQQPRCPLLDAQDRCAIYADRPLVCRTQGLPLLYPADLIPLDAIRWRASADQAIVACPLNFLDPTKPPTGQDVLDAQRVDELLAIIQHLYEKQQGSLPHTRHSLRALLHQALDEKSAHDPLPADPPRGAPRPCPQP